MKRGITEGQHEVLAVLSKSDRPCDTNLISSKAGHRYGPWAYEKLRVLCDRGLVLRWAADRVTLTTWTITDAGREALLRSNTPPSPAP